ncbi:MAG: hypothetical protein QM757_26000 [Paludibaculum sp.]
MRVPCRTSSGAGRRRRRHLHTHLVVQPFEFEAGQDLPAQFVRQLRKDPVASLGKTGRFHDVTALELGEARPASAEVELSGKITRFQKGNLALRYWTVPGVGATKIKAMFEFCDLATGRTFYSTEVDVKVAFGVFGGNSLGATNGLAKDVSEVVKKHLP